MKPKTALHGPETTSKLKDLRPKADPKGGDTSTPKTTSTGTGKTTIGDITITKKTDVASPNLF